MAKTKTTKEIPEEEKKKELVPVEEQQEILVENPTEEDMKEAEETGETLEIGEGGEEVSEPKTRNKNVQVRFIFKSEKGWFEKERDNVRITKYYKTQKEAIEAAKQHIKNSGMRGRIVIQSKKGKIRANTKVAAKK